MGVACVWHGAACVLLVFGVDVEKGTKDAARTLAERRGAGGARVAPEPVDAEAT